MIRRGIYCTEERWLESGESPADRHAIEVNAGWLALGRRGWATDYSAALLHDLPVPHGQPDRVTMSLPQRPHGRRSYDGPRLRTVAVLPHDVVIVRDVPVARVALVAADVARNHGFGPGLILADAGLRNAVEQRTAFNTVVSRMQRWPGARDARLVAEHANGAREAPTESLSFAVFATAGLELPDCNAWVVGHGRGGVRSDFVWWAHRLVGEVDGQVKYTDPLWRPADEVLVDEKVRQLRIEEVGFVVVRWTGVEIMRRPHVVVERIVRQSRVAARMFGVPALG